MEFDDKLKDFVRRMCHLGRTDAQIRAVARCTHWKTRMDQIMELLERKGKRYRTEQR